MSRHSKNNTASSVFTYGEKQKLKEYGTNKQRIGQDSQRKFEMCHLCLYKVESPMTCEKGHIFCKNCLVEYMATEKLRIKKLIEDHDEKKKIFECKKQDAELKKKEEFIEKFDRLETNIISKTQRKKSESSNEDNDEAIKNIKDLQLNALNLGKVELIKENFWVPETHKAPENLLGEPPSEKIVCPASQKHHIKFKKCYKVVFCEDTQKNFICFSCKKELKFQKVMMGKKCGHVFCKICMEKLCLKDQRCSHCSLPLKHDHVISIQEGFTGFIMHNSVEAEKYQPAFVG